MSTDKKIDCLEFKRIALADPNSQEHAFVEHSAHCPDCLAYVGSVKQMDADLSSSLETPVPSDLLAKLASHTDLPSDGDAPHAPTNVVQVPNYFWNRPRAMAASLAAALVISVAMFSDRLIPPAELGNDYQQLVSAVMEHMDEVPSTQRWDAERANQSVNTLLASYDSSIKMKYMDNLSFGRICPMGQYRGLHATLETPDGKVTFAYLKGDPVEASFDAELEGYVSRVKPVQGGNIVIVSPSSASLEMASEEITNAVSWDL